MRYDRLDIVLLRGAKSRIIRLSAKYPIINLITRWDHVLARNFRVTGITVGFRLQIRKG